MQHFLIRIILWCKLVPRTKKELPGLLSHITRIRTYMGISQVNGTSTFVGLRILGVIVLGGILGSSYLSKLPYSSLTQVGGLVPKP